MQEIQCVRHIRTYSGHIVCPRSLGKYVFFSAAMVDNVDHNPSSRQAEDVIDKC